MPIWPVSFVDGVFQVADADGAHYPLTMQHVGVPQFNPGWRPRGLQTGLPPLHVLELVHDDGQQEAVWFMDELLDYRGNAVMHLSPDDRTRYLDAVEPLVREIFEQAITSRHDAVPAAAHTFDGFLPSSLRELLALPASRVIPRPDVVRPGALREVGAYGRDGVSLQATRVDELLQDTVPADGPGVLELGQHRALRRFDERSGTTSYLLQGADPADRHLYVPALGAVFGEGDATHDPVLPLVLYYATHLDRAVPLPEAAELGFELVEPFAPPQHGLDEPPVATAPPIPEPGPLPDPRDRTVTDPWPGSAPRPAPVVHAAPEPGSLPEDATTDARPAAVPTGPAPNHAGPDLADPAYAEPELETPLHAPLGFDDPAVAVEHATNPEGTRTPEPALVEAGSPRADASDRPSSLGRQNWWQRLLGLGNP